MILIQAYSIRLLSRIRRQVADHITWTVKVGVIACIFNLFSNNPYSDQSLLNTLAKSPRTVAVSQTLLIGETDDSDNIVQLGLKERFIPIYLST